MFNTSKKVSDAYLMRCGRISGYEYEKKRLDNKIKEEKKILQHIEKQLIKKHSSFRVGDRFKLSCGEVWHIEYVTVTYYGPQKFNFSYTLTPIKQGNHRFQDLNSDTLAKHLASGSFVPVDENAKSIAKSTKLQTIILHKTGEWDATYVGVTPRGKYIMFSAPYATLHKNYETGNLRLFRKANGDYEVKKVKPDEYYYGTKADNMYVCRAKILGVFNSRTELTVKLLTK